MNEFAPSSNGIVSRFSIAILSCISLGIGLGSMIHLRNAELCALAGALGFGFYLFLDQHTKAANRRQVQNVRETSERRLSELSSCTMPTIDPSAARPIANAS